jgi:hypothetical protein
MIKIDSEKIKQEIVDFMKPQIIDESECIILKKIYNLLHFEPKFHFEPKIFCNLSTIDPKSKNNYTQVLIDPNYLSGDGLRKYRLEQNTLKDKTNKRIKKVMVNLETSFTKLFKSNCLDSAKPLIRKKIKKQITEINDLEHKRDQIIAILNKLNYK